MKTASVVLLENATATGDAKQWPGGVGHFSVGATFNGATISLQYLMPNGSSWVDAGDDTTLTAEGGGVFTLGPCQLRCAVSVAVPAAVYATAVRVPE